MEHEELRGPEAPPTPEEFEEARQRELARLNFRVSSIKGQTFHTPEDEKLLEGDSAGRRTWPPCAAGPRTPPGKAEGPRPPEGSHDPTPALRQTLC